MAVEICLMCIGFWHPRYRLHYTIVILGVGKSKVLPREDYKKRGGRGQEAAAIAWGDHDTRSRSQSGGNLVNGGKVKE